MIVIIGGAYQGKLEFAINKYNLLQDELCDLAMGFLPEKKCYYHFEEYTRNNDSLPDFQKESIVISREIGSGIVPMEKEDREHRKAHGLALQKLAKEADEVYQVFCGLARRIK